MRRKKQAHKKSPLNHIEQKMLNLLNSMGFSFSPQVTIGEYNVDFLVNKKYIIECYGDYWHCNPAKYAPDYYNRGKKKTAKDIWARDEKRKRIFEEQGYKVLYFWESEINNDIKNIRSVLLRYIV